VKVGNDNRVELNPWCLLSSYRKNGEIDLAVYCSFVSQEKSLIDLIRCN